MFFGLPFPALFFICIFFCQLNPLQFRCQPSRVFWIFLIFLLIMVSWKTFQLYTSSVQRVWIFLWVTEPLAFLFFYYIYNGSFDFQPLQNLIEYGMLFMKLFRFQICLLQKSFVILQMRFVIILNNPCYYYHFSISLCIIPYKCIWRITLSLLFLGLLFIFPTDFGAQESKF